ncbi:MAG: putative Lipid biosynthesis (KDO)2-(lauroyl)-lipid acyltransferase [Rickettsiaceae bacterium]|jgi:KDO2-lipid IV(A) lauroyltransferase|nr:putative Lipid biosynthesis (KDO)2-(lauroyl)-lipid acyltransferase [Rickettsiaceae bacterium]
MMLKFRHILEAVAVKSIYCLFKLMPIETASSIAGSLGRAIGPLLSVNKVAGKNIRNALPELSDAEVNNVLKGMWDNLGRVVGEFPHMKNVTGKLFDEIAQVEGAENIQAANGRNTSTIFFSGHFSNWEMIPKTIYEKGSPTVQLVYRKSNNPYLDKLILDTRAAYSSNSIPKGSVGARYLINAIKKGHPIGMLVDQKQNDGIAVPFFHKPAMTAPAIANLALKYDCALVPLQAIRTKGAKFKIKAYPPMTLTKTGDTEQDILNIMQAINEHLENFIRENPSQWFWVHNRWPK